MEKDSILLGYSNNILMTFQHMIFVELMALPFLPAEHIEPAFRNIQEHASSGTQLELATYIKDTWILGNWHPKDWSIFNQAVRRNNDVERWHLRINTRAR